MSSYLKLLTHIFLPPCQVFKITGDDNIPAEQVKQIIKGDDFAVLVVTPAIIGNYFAMCAEASLSDFTLLIFDEYHHAKKDHPYNDLIRRCLGSARESESPVNLPQVSSLVRLVQKFNIHMSDYNDPHIDGKLEGSQNLCFLQYLIDIL